MLSLKNYILTQVARQALSQDEAKQLLAELKSNPERPSPEMAIVGMSGRFPLSRNVDEFWEKLKKGINCISDYPEARRRDFEHILRNPHYTEFLIGDAIRTEDIPKAHARAGYLPEIDTFDAGFFGIPPNEATFMDPYQRVALETAWSTLEDAGYGGDVLAGSSTGVYLGKENTNYSLYRYCSVKDPMQLTGSWESIMASRISYLFNFRGPCLVIDTACSAGLVSIHMAIQAILQGECDQALAGGINLSVTGEFSPRFQGGMNMDAVESKEGVIRTFDARASGTVWGEGVAMVLIKPLAKALADGDNIHAIIRGSAINNDGASNGLTAPNAEAQEEVIVKAWEKAQINPEHLSYIEAHGTGTNLGDPIEFKGLTSAFRRYTQKRQFCAVGSLKTNMGHLVAASGCASLFKVVKSLAEEQMPPTINFGEPNPYINFLSSPLYVQDSLQSWPRQNSGQPRLAALSSFGFSHTNCHMVVQEAPRRTPRRALQPAYCFTLSAKRPELLRESIHCFQKFLQRPSPDLADICYTLQCGRGHYAHRLAIVASTSAELRQRLATAERRLAETVDTNSLSNSTGSTSSEDGVFFGYHKVVSDRKTQRDPGEFTARELKQLSQEAQTFLSKYRNGPDVGTLVQMATRYVRGAEVSWADLYKNEPRYRVSLPGYSYERKRVWADPKITKIISETPSVLHPLVHRRTSSTEGEHTFESTFNIKNQWVLSDHKIQKAAVVPGTTYLEMARVAALESFGWRQLRLENLFFLQPMVAQPDESLRVRTRLQVQADGSANLTIESTPLNGSVGENWTRHVEGQVRREEGAGSATPASLDLTRLQKDTDHTVLDYRGGADTGVFQFGPHWDTVREEWKGQEQHLARLALPPELRREVATFQLHPSMLDNAVNLTSQNFGATFLPYFYKSLRLFAPFTEEIYTLIRQRPGRAGLETQTFDVILTDPQGQVLAEINQYVTKKVHSFNFSEETSSASSVPGFVQRWVPFMDLTSARLPKGRWLILSQGAERSVVLAQALETAGSRVVHYTLPSEPTRESLLDILQHSAPTTLDGILFTPDFDRVEVKYLESAAAFHDQRARGVDALLHLTQALLELKLKLSWGLGIITTHGCQVTHEGPCDPLGAATLALGATVAQENGHLQVRLVDAAAKLDADSLLGALGQVPSGKLVAVREDELFVPQLQDAGLEKGEPFKIAEDGIYIITGGLGGLGLAAAEFLTNRAESQGKKARIALLGRSQVPSRADWDRLATDADTKKSRRFQQLLRLETRLQALEVRSIDVANPTELSTEFGTLRARHGRIAGVFHAAGVAGNGFLLRKKWSQFDEVLRPKLDGTRNLFTALQSSDCATLVLYSSTTALTSGEGQGDYAAANAFLDAMATHSAAPTRAVQITTVNWPSWNETGMAVDFHIEESQVPFSTISNDEAFRALEACWTHGRHRFLPGKINAAVLRPVQASLPFDLSREIQQLLARTNASAPPNAVASNPSSEDYNVQILGKSQEDLTSTEIVVSKIYAAVLGLKEIDLYSSFQDLGGNSIIATHLLKVLDTHFPKIADISDVFSYPSVEMMAEYLDQRLGKASAKLQPVTTESNHASKASHWESIVDQVAEGGSIETAIEAALQPA